MSKNDFETWIRSIDSDLFELINNLICSICHEIFTKPVTTQCGHSFCSGCIKRVISNKNNSGCPLCKNPVTRYCLESNEVESTLCEIFKELPAAFEKDVKDLCADLDDTAEDLLKFSKLAQLSGQECENVIKSNKRKTSFPKKTKKAPNNSENTEVNDNDIESFVPVLKRSKNVIQYGNAKKKKGMDDLISISQREVPSNSNVCESSEFGKKLGQIEKLSPEDKIQEWFNAVGNNLYLSSPSANNFDSPPIKNVMESPVSSKVITTGERSSSMVRRDYKKVANPLHSNENEKESVKRNILILDENKNDCERENEREISVGNVKSSDEFSADRNHEVTASQKFDKLLSESKENDKKGNLKAHVLYSVSQASSTQFLDCSYESQIHEKKMPRKTSRVNFKKSKNLIPSNDENKTGISTNYYNTRYKTLGMERNAKTERKHSLNNEKTNINRKQPFYEIMDLKSQEALDLEQSVEEYLLNCKKDINTPKGSKLDKKNDAGTKVSCCEKTSEEDKTKRIEFLEELANDDTVYENHPRNTLMQLRNQKKVGNDFVSVMERSTSNKTLFTQTLQVTTNKNFDCGSMSCAESETLKAIDNIQLENFTQNTNLLGFCTPEELPEETIFKEMVKKMERELALLESNLKCKPFQQKHCLLTPEANMDDKFESNTLNNNFKKESQKSKPQIVDPEPPKNGLMDSSLIPFNCLGKIRKDKSCLIRFLRLGRLTPLVKRSKSSVVKLVFPVGFSSFTRRRAFEYKFPTGFHTSKSLPSTTKNNFITLKNVANEYCALQYISSNRNTLMSTAIQTSQMVSSAEFQTTHISKSAIIQTSQQMKASVEIQTIKDNLCSAAIQTSQESKIYKSAEIQTSQPPCESCQRQLPLFSKISSHIETRSHLPGSFRGDEGETLSKTNNSRVFEDNEFSCRDVKSSKDQKYFSKEEITDILPPPNLFHKNKAQSLAPPRKYFFRHKKISSKKKFQKTSSPEKLSSPSHGRKNPKEIQDDMFQDKSSTSGLIIDSEMEKEFEDTWMKKSQSNHEDLVKTKNNKNRDNSRKREKITQALDNELFREQSCDSRSPAKKLENSPALLTRNLSGLIDEVLEKYEKHQRIPLDVRKVSSDDQYETIDLGTPNTGRDSQKNSENQIFEVLKNIDLDLKGKENKKRNNKGLCVSKNPGNSIKGEKSEESDSDYFVEQTPPRPSNSRIADPEAVNPLGFDGKRNSLIGKIENEADDGKDILNSDETDLIEDSEPKYLPKTENFLLDSAFQKILTPEKSNRKVENNKKTYLEKSVKSGSQGFPKEKSFSSVQKFEDFSSSKANENDQNQLNAASENKLLKREPETKSRQLKAVVGAWVKVDDSDQTKVISQTRKKLCVVASSVKNLDIIKRFVNKFRIEYSSKPTKSMTHLIVGLHENEEEGGVLPHCTPKFLFAMANKKWIVSESWAESCLKMSIILPEESFEAFDPVGGQGCRSARLSTEPLFKDCEIYLLGNFQTISKGEFANLILDCGGTVIQKPEQFSFLSQKLRMIVADQDCLNMDEKQLQELHEKYSTVILSRDVIIMSIQSYKLAHFIPHLLHLTSEEDLIKMGYPSALVKSE